MKKKRRIIYFFAAVFLLGAVVLPDIIYSAVPKSALADVQLRDVSITKTVSGRVTAKTKAAVTADYAAVIGKFFCAEGDYLKKGEIVAQIDCDKTVRANLSGDSPDYAAAERAARYITMPKSGRISKIAEAGAVIGAGTPIVQYIPDDSLILTLRLSESAAAEVKRGQRVTFSGASFSGSFEGEIETIGAAIDSDSGAVSAVASIRSCDARLRAGCSVSAKIYVGTIADALCLPQETILQEGKTEFVYVYYRGTAARRKIKTSHYVDGSAVVVSGVKHGDTVLVNTDGISGDSVHVIAIGGGLG